MGPRWSVVSVLRIAAKNHTIPMAAVHPRAERNAPDVALVVVMMSQRSLHGARCRSVGEATFEGRY